jgi:hypothetical protein
MKKIILSIAVVFSFFCGSAQTREQALDPHADDRIKVGYETYVDFHYTYDFNRPINNKRYTNSNPEYVNQFGLAYTYGQLYLEYGRMQVRAAAHAGDIVDIMYINETEIFKYIRELSLTYKLRDNLEVQTGIFPAIFGAETFINKDNLHATRAVMTDFAPDYEAGFRLKYKMGKYWQGTAQFTNGWQVVRDNNHAPAFGIAQVYDKPGRFLFNYGFFAGEETYDLREQKNSFKMYHNLFGRVYAGKWTIAPLFDIGMIRDSVTHNMNYWHAYGGSIRYAVGKKMGIAARYEHINDPDQIINDLVRTNLPQGGKLDHGFIYHGSTLTFEYLPNSDVTFRLEVRDSRNIDAIFTDQNGIAKSKTDFFIMFSIAMKFTQWGLVKVNRDPVLKNQF